MINKKIITTKNKESRTIFLCVRVTPTTNKWLKKKKYSPTKIFYEALKEIGYKEDKNDKTKVKSNKSKSRRIRKKN